MPSFIAYDGKRFAEKLDRYITTIVFKDGRRCKCIICNEVSKKYVLPAEAWETKFLFLPKLIFILNRYP